MKHRNDRSQSQHGDKHGDKRGDQHDQRNQRDQLDQRAAQPGASGRDAAAQSEQRLDQEERSLVGDTAADRNLTGSTTYVTLPEQRGDARDQRNQRDQHNAGKPESQGKSASGSSTRKSSSGSSPGSRSTHDRDTPR